MPISSKSVVENKELSHGYRVKLEYVFDDGYISTIKCKGLYHSDAERFLIEKESQVLHSKSQMDTDSAIANNSYEQTPDAGQLDMYRAWVRKGYDSKEPDESYFYLSKVADKIIMLGLSDEQLASTFGEPLETIRSVMSRWNYLEENKDIILAYKEIKGSM